MSKNNHLKIVKYSKDNSISIIILVIIIVVIVLVVVI